MKSVLVIYVVGVLLWRGLCAGLMLGIAIGIQLRKVAW